MNRNRMSLVLAAMIALTLGLSGGAWADIWEHERDGVVLGFNIGGGSAGLEVDNVGDSDRESGAAGSFRFGYAFRPEWAVGLESNAWTKEIDDETWTFSVAALGFTYYPNAAGFFLRGGIGFGSISAESDEGNFTVRYEDNGIGILGGLGYEWRLTRRFALGPQVDFGYTDVGEGVSANYVNFTAGFNWYL